MQLIVESCFKRRIRKPGVSAHPCVLCRCQFNLWLAVSISVVYVGIGVGVGNGQETPGLQFSNQPPFISFLWPAARPVVAPTAHFSFRNFLYAKLRVDARDPDGAISEVRFFAGTNQIGTVKSPPYNLVWELPAGFWGIRAVAIDNAGSAVAAQGGTISVSAFGRPPESYVEILTPPTGAMYAAPATFQVAAEVLVSGGENGPIEFQVDRSPVGIGQGGGTLTAITPPTVLTVTNLAEGNHFVGIRYLGPNGCVQCPGVTNHIRVVRLGVHSPKTRLDGARQFEVVTSYGGKLHVIEASPDMVDWCSIAVTNAPAANSFTFVVPACGRPDDRYYRVLVPQP